MKRILVIALALVFAVAVTTQAQDFKTPNKSTAASSVTSGSVFSKASVERAVAAVTRATPPPPRMNMHKFMRSPWPYVIAAGIVAVLILTVGGSPLSSTPY